MPILINRLKLEAAAGSMHQFCQSVRTFFPDSPSDTVVESATAFLYLRTARAVFGRRFSEKLREKLRVKYKFADATSIELHISRIDAQREAFERTMKDVDPEFAGDDEFSRHVRCVIRALLSESGDAFDDAELVKTLFPRFEEMARRIRSHLDGIRGQSQFIMKRA